MPDHIELVCGKAAWLAHLETVGAIVSAVLLLFSPAPLPFRLSAIAALSVFMLAERRFSAPRQAFGTLHLRLDGTVRHRGADTTTEGMLTGSGWFSRHLCVVGWRPLDGGWRRHSLVCASSNRTNDYRRLLVWMRLGALDSAGAAAR